MDKFKIGDTMIVTDFSHNQEEPQKAIVIDYKPGGFGWLESVKYEVRFNGSKHTWLMSDTGSPDVWTAKVYTIKEYEKVQAKEEYSEILDHGNGD